jgi:hypothetical protein
MDLFTQGFDMTMTNAAVLDRPLDNPLIGDVQPSLIPASIDTEYAPGTRVSFRNRIASLAVTLSFAAGAAVVALPIATAIVSRSVETTGPAVPATLSHQSTLLGLILSSMLILPTAGLLAAVFGAALQGKPKLSTIAAGIFNGLLLAGVLAMSAQG